MTKILIIVFALLTAIFETIGASGCTLLWKSTEDSKLKGVLLIIIGFGGSVLSYIIMRKYVTDLVLAQGIFIAGTALFAILATFFIQKTSLLDSRLMIGVVFIAIGSIIINYYLPE